MQKMKGLEAQTLTAFQQQMEQNHAPKTLYFGDIKTAVAKEGTDTKYEVVYVEIKDNLVNKNGNAISSAIKLRNAVFPLTARVPMRLGTPNSVVLANTFADSRKKVFKSKLALSNLVWPNAPRSIAPRRLITMKPTWPAKPPSLLRSKGLLTKWSLWSAVKARPTPAKLA